jgi:hypothetical protein
VKAIDVANSWTSINLKLYKTKACYSDYQKLTTDGNVDFEEQYMRLTHEPRNQNLKNLANI